MAINSHDSRVRKLKKKEITLQQGMDFKICIVRDRGDGNEAGKEIAVIVKLRHCAFGVSRNPKRSKGFLWPIFTPH